MSAIDLCRARLHTVDVMRRLNMKAARYRSVHNLATAEAYKSAAGYVLMHAMDIAADLARERELMQQRTGEGQS